MLCEHQRCGAACGEKGEKLEISWPGTAWFLKTFSFFFEEFLDMFLSVGNWVEMG